MIARLVEPELLLGERVGTRGARHGQPGKAPLEDPRIHHFAYRHTRGGVERGPQIGGLGVGVSVVLQIVAHPLAEGVFAEILLEHPQHRRSLEVGEVVEHLAGLFRRLDGKLDRPRRLGGVGTHRIGAIGGEGEPGLPIRPERVDTLHRGECGEGLVEPDAVPPLHRDQITEPHVGDLVGNHLSDPHQLGLGGAFAVEQKGGLSVGDRSEVLHRSPGEVGDGDHVHLVARVGDVVVVGVEAQGEGAGLEGVVGEMPLPGNVGDTQRDTVDVDRVGDFELADDEGDEIGRHLHGVLERDGDLAAAGAFSCDLRAV